MAVIGLGGMGALHAGILASLPDTRLVAAVDSESRLVKMASKAINTVHFYTDSLQMLDAERPEAVYLCTPAATHLPLTKGILNSPNTPRALFVEKPLATTSQDAEEMVRLARAHATITGVGHQRRFLPTIQKTRELIGAQAIGTPMLLRCHHFSSSVLAPAEGWRFTPGTGGGVTLELGVHLLDIVVMLFGEPATITGLSTRLFSTAVEDYIACQLKFPSGLVGVLELGWSLRGYDPPELRIEVHGDRGALVATEDAVYMYSAATESGFRKGVDAYYGARLTPRLPFLLGGPENVLIDLDFIKSVREGSNPQVTFESAARINHLLEMIRPVSWTGG